MLSKCAMMVRLAGLTHAGRGDWQMAGK